MRRLGAGKDAHPTIDTLRRERIDVVFAHAVAAGFPGFAVVTTDLHRAVKRARKGQAAFRLLDDRADMLVGDRAMNDFPICRRTVALTRDNTLAAAHLNFLRRRRRVTNLPPA